MLKWLTIFAALALTSAAHAQCAGGSTAQQAQGNMQRKSFASDVGGQLGGMFGSAMARRAGLGSMDGRKLGKTLGNQAGLAAAGPLTRDLDACDQQWVTHSTQQTLDSGQTTQWSGETGTSGANKIVPTDPAVLASNPGKICRTVQQSITLSDGSAGVQKVAACKGDDGVWQPAKS
jgi:hypothetical protein